MGNLNQIDSYKDHIPSFSVFIIMAGKCDKCKIREWEITYIDENAVEQVTWIIGCKWWHGMPDPKPEVTACTRNREDAQA